MELIGSLDGMDHYNADSVATLFQGNHIPLALRSDFVGRPVTLIYLGEQDVIKVRSELNFDKSNSLRWAKIALRKERELGIHHPHKTWFVTDAQELRGKGESAIIGNICPRLKPVHTLFESGPTSAWDKQQYLDILTTIFDQYLRLAKSRGFKMDEGLSNFGVDAHGTVFYIDDEIYPWDNFVSFSIMLGVYIRSFGWLDSEFIHDVALATGRLIDAIFGDPHCKVIIAGQMRALFMPNKEKMALVQQFIDMLLQIGDAFRLVRTSTGFPRMDTKEAHARTARLPASRHIAIMADIHANYPALESVLNYLKSKNIREGIILGDIVGYGPDPVECIETLDASPFIMIKGNHDHAVAIGKTDTGISATAKTVIDWTIGQLSEDHRKWLNSLPVIMESGEWLAVHGAPLDPAYFYAYVYLMTAEDNLDYLEKNHHRLCFHGHSHMPGIFARDRHKFDQHFKDATIDLNRFKFALACPGSIGQPRNGHRGAQFAIFDRKERVLNFVTLPYDVEPVIHKLREHHLPDQLAQRLLNAK